MDVGGDEGNGGSDNDNYVCDKHCDDDVTCGVGWLYWQEVWRNRGMREWSCEVTRSQKTKPLFGINGICMPVYSLYCT